MTIDEMRELLTYDEPSFSYNGIEYCISHPRTAFYVWSQANPDDESLVFDTVNDLLEKWLIDGSRFCDILHAIHLG